jgi:hypothetical protein
MAGELGRADAEWAGVMVRRLRADEVRDQRECFPGAEEASEWLDLPAMAAPSRTVCGEVLRWRVSPDSAGALTALEFNTCARASRCQGSGWRAAPFENLAGGGGDLGLAGGGELALGGGELALGGGELALTIEVSPPPALEVAAPECIHGMAGRRTATLFWRGSVP